MPWRPLLLLSSLTGCHSANSYAVARSLPPGQVSASLAFEGYQIKRTSHVSNGEPFPERKSESNAFVLPTGMVSYGVSRRVEARGSLRNLYSAGLDVKVQLLHGPVAMALMPGAQVNPRVAMASLPLLLDLRVDDWLTFVLSPGLAAGARLDSRPTTAQPDGLYGQLGLGIRLKVTERISLHPEITLMRSLTDPSTRWLTVGLGLIGAGAP